MKADFPNLFQIPSGKKGDGFPDLHRAIMSFNGWLRGMHHQVEHLQSYVDEYTYRFNRNFMKTGLFENLMKRMMECPLLPYKMIYKVSA